MDGQNMSLADFWDEDESSIESSVSQYAVKLQNLSTAINDWQSFATKQLNETAEADRKRPEVQELVDYDQYLQGQEEILFEIEHMMYGGLAVSVLSSAESVLRMLCNKQGKVLKPKANLKTIRETLEPLLKSGGKFDSLAEFSNANCARMLGNCYKHNDGKADKEWAEQFAVTIGDELEYIRDDWPKLIESTKTFLLALAKDLP